MWSRFHDGAVSFAAANVLPLAINNNGHGIFSSARELLKRAVKYWCVRLT